MNWQLNVIWLMHLKNITDTKDTNIKTVTFEGGGFLTVDYYILHFLVDL